MTQTVFSIPLGSGAVATAGASPRVPTTRSPVLNEFIAGPENRLAAIAVESVFEHATPSVTPLVLYGPTQCGKTHLARGLAEWWKRRHPATHVQTLTGAEYAQQYADAVDNDHIPAWRAKLRTVQMLVIDDLAGLAGKRGAQQELRQLLDELLDCQALVVVTMQSLPQVAAGLSGALQSRLSSGLAVQVNIPGSAARREIVDRFAAARGTLLSKRAAQALADSLNVPAPILLGALMELESAARADDRPIDAERIRRYVADHIREKPLTIRDVAIVTARYFSLTLADLKSASRHKAMVSARSMAIYLARNLTDQSLSQIGKYFGGRDHTTVMHSLRKIEKLTKTDPPTRQAISELRRLIAMNQ